MKTRSITAALGASALLLGLAACGTTDPDEGSNASSVSTAGDCADDTTETTSAAVSLTDSWGRTVDLDKPAERVAVLEWQQTEDLLTLCVNPVAVADVKGYSLWDTAEKVADDATDVGTRGEPNFDALLATNPDLVVVETYSPTDEIIGQLEKYDLKVLATKGADTKDPIQNMKDTFSLIAEATGRAERAEAVIAEFDQELAEAKDELAKAALPSTKFLYFDGYIDGGNVALRPFGQGSLMGELGEELGLENAWTDEVDAAYGLGSTDIEGLTKVGDATLFYTGTVDPSGEFAPEMQKNKLWNTLPAVKDDRVFAFPSGIWTFGGPKSAAQALDAYVDLLTD